MFEFTGVHTLPVQKGFLEKSLAFILLCKR